MRNSDPDFLASSSIRTHLIAALAVSFFLVGGVGVWAATAKLSGAVVASGHLVVDSYVKKVQHPTGGVVGEILVNEGDHVATGQVVMRLDATQTRANLAIVSRRLDELSARRARLEAERDDQQTLTFPQSLLDRQGDLDVAAAMQSETRLFQSRKTFREGQKAQLNERIAQFRHEIEGLKAQEVAYDQGLSVLQAEIGSQKGLRDQGVVSVQRLNSLETQAATFGGERGEKIAYQAQVAGRISETRLQIIQIDQELKTEVGRELREIEGQMGEFAERKVAAQDQLKRVDIVAPQAGVVHQMAVHTVGGVVTPADPIMMIVPEGDDLALEVQIAPKDIDQLQLGQEALLRMSSFNQRVTPEVNGHIVRIAPDLTVDQRTGQSYYLVRLVVNEGERAKLGGLALLPGMPAEAFIRTSERTALSYILKPLTDQITRAFREE
ncbi:HlyD family type I secretion periplasmic adaptor subunit [Agrobacterium larrymoorei]|uniref:Membrane fusion protein (MFP) family protein n=1 Tax=Agrobacterium larrymoorei TaxID=160699 RepID=A0A4D7DV19_9HYPH|nr:HlyD family type I secretion periplasmic adaptor subunit [Agrobacterium larrymoorei]QCI99417.1 HlyD family type I secretion periplasmic adaptor subunit [Agrobacterium larrymoorei]QYA08960.1 HlyD family type I secretion periplasmic adaptor subunit [Agrobacterium larrymoorei]